MRILIFAAGELDYNEFSTISREKNDLVIAADGGSHHCLTLGIQPDIVIGDLDSIDADDLELVESWGTQIIKFPSRKDFTDLELALQYACDQNADEILVYGSLGLRWDQTLANILLLASPVVACKKIKLVDGKQEIHLISSNAPLLIEGNPGDTVSLIPISGDATGVTSENLEYALNEGILIFGASRGVSNLMTATSASITLKKGRLICVVIHK